MAATYTEICTIIEFMMLNWTPRKHQTSRELASLYQKQNINYAEYDSTHIKLHTEYKKSHPETIGETDTNFDKSNYIDFLEQKINNMNLHNEITFETLENYLQTIYEANKNGELVNINESAVFVLNICNEIRKNLINNINNENNII